MKKKTIIIIVASVVALAVIIAGVIVLLSSGFNPAKPDSTNSEPTSSLSDTSSDKQEADESAADNKDNSQSKNSSNKTGNEDKTDTGSNKKDDNAPNEAAFYISNTSAKVGETVKVPVKVTKNPGFMAFIINFEYDTKALKYKKYSAGDVLTNYEIEDKDGVIKFMSVENGDVKKDGTLVYLEFEVLKGASGKSEIKVNVPEKSVANYNEQFVNIASQNGYVEIK